MTGYQAIALDVGGVIYYDEPFELAWIHRVLARACAADPSFTVPDLIRDMEIFYAVRRLPRDHTDTVFSRPFARQSWLEVRAGWNDLVQPIPGAVDAVRQLAGPYDVCVVANQPPECVEALGRLHLGDAFALVALDSIVGYAKPDPRLLGWALARIGFRAAQTLVVGNRWDHDIAPAQALGCPTVLIRPDDGWIAPPGSDPDVVTAYRRVRSQFVSQSLATHAGPVVANLGELATTLIPILAELADDARPA